MHQFFAFLLSLFVSGTPTAHAANFPFTCPRASTNVSGCVQVDGTSITITNGVISSSTGGSGNVTGPLSSITGDLPSFNGTTGKILQDSGILASAVALASGMTSGQLGIANGANSFNSSIPFGLTGNSTIVETTAGGLLTPSILPLATSAAFGAIKGDGSTLPISAGVISCTTSTVTQLGCVKPDGSSITISVSGVLSASIAGATPTTTAGPAAITGTAATFMRSDGAPAVQKATGAQFGLVETDGLTTLAVAGVISSGLPIPNAGTTGTTQFLLAKLTGAGTAVVATTSDTGGVILGAVQSGAGTTGSAFIAEGGQATCTFDGATTQDDFVQVSTTAGGDCHDTGSASFPTTGGQVLGRVLSTHAAGGNFLMAAFPPGIIPSTGGGGSASFTLSTKTGSYAVNGTTDVGVHFDNNGASATVPFTLPTGANGLNYCFMNLVSGQSITITAPTSIKISNGEVQSGGAGVLTLPNLGDGECLEFLQSQWFAYNGVGSWSLQ